MSIFQCIIQKYHYSPSEIGNGVNELFLLCFPRYIPCDIAFLFADRAKKSVGAENSDLNLGALSKLADPFDIALRHRREMSIIVQLKMDETRYRAIPHSPPPLPRSPILSRINYEVSARLALRSDSIVK